MILVFSETKDPALVTLSLAKNFADFKAELHRSFSGSPGPGIDDAWLVQELRRSLIYYSFINKKAPPWEKGRGLG